MDEQNIFDNETFFNGYRELRATDANYNEQLEQPAMSKLLPDVYGKSVLDIKAPRLIQFNYSSADFAA